MSDINDGGPAFPNPALANESFCPGYDLSGLTKREWFAGIALACVPPHLQDLQTDQRIKIAEWAVGLADAMIAESQKDTSK